MWIRYHIKCHNCDKITNLRLQLTSTDKIVIKFKCPNEMCKTDLEGILNINYSKFKNYKPSLITRINGIRDKSYGFMKFQRNFHDSLKLEMSRGINTDGDFTSGDYFLEYSDELRVSESNNTGHNPMTPFLRQAPKGLMENMVIDKLRNIYDDDLWYDLNDLLVAYQNTNYEGVKLIVEKMKIRCLGYDNIHFEFDKPIDYIHSYFHLMNHFLFPWINTAPHLDFVTLIFQALFENERLQNQEVADMCVQYTEPEFLKKFNYESGEILIRFVKNRKLFSNIYPEMDLAENIISNPNFELIKTLFTDSFEFVGRYSVIPLKLMNLIERDSVSAMTSSRLSIEGFESINHGSRMDIINQSSTREILEIFDNRFDSRLRNGINHFKTKMNPKNQVISYFPLNNRPDEEYGISYYEFLYKTLGMVESVMRINQIIKMFHYHNRDRTSS